MAKTIGPQTVCSLTRKNRVINAAAAPFTPTMITSPTMSATLTIRRL
jgi:hypothetical protein